MCTGKEENEIVDENCFVISVFQIHTSYSVSLYVSYPAYYSHRQYSHTQNFFMTLAKFPIIYKISLCHVFPVAEKAKCYTWHENPFCYRYLVSLKMFLSTPILRRKKHEECYLWFLFQSLYILYSLISPPSSCFKSLNNLNQKLLAHSSCESSSKNNNNKAFTEHFISQ